MRRRLGLAVAAVASLSSGCQDRAEGSDEGATDTEESRDPVDPPNFIQPASGVLMLSSNRTDEVRLRLANVSASTRLVVDGTSYGDLSSAPWIGSLATEELVLRMGGGLVAGRHTVFLETPSVDEPVRSEEIQVNVLVDNVPALAASLSAEGSLRGSGILAQGLGEQSLLLVYDELSEPQPRVVAYRTEGSTWDLDAPVSVSVPRLELLDGILPLSGTLTTKGTETRADDRLRLAWRENGSEIAFVERRWETLGGSPQTALALDQIDTTGVEFASLGVPTIVGDAIFVETNLLTDTESSRPGDHRLSVVSLLGEPALPSTPRLTAPLGVSDIDRVGPALDLRSLGLDVEKRPNWIAARVQGARAAVFEVESNGTLRLRGTALELGGWQNTRLPVSAVVGAFGSRTMFGAGGSQALVQTFDDWGEAAPTDASTALIGGGTEANLGRPAVTVLGGHPVMLLPMGSGSPVQAVAMAGSRINAQAIDLLRCEEIAVPAVTEGATGMSVQFACRGGDEIRLGTLALVE